MLAGEESTSIDWAREIRGTASTARAVIGSARQCDEFVDEVGVQPRAQPGDEGGALGKTSQVGIRWCANRQNDCGPPRFPRVDNLRASGDVLGVREGRGGARTLLNHHLVAKFHQLGCRRWGGGHAGFPLRGFRSDANCQRCSFGWLHVGPRLHRLLNSMICAGYLLYMS